MKENSMGVEAKKRRPYAAFVATMAGGVLATAAAVNAVSSDAALADAPGSRLHETIEREFEFAEGGTVVIRNVNGAVAVRGWDGDTVQVTVEKRLDVLADGMTVRDGALGRTELTSDAWLKAFEETELEVREDEAGLSLSVERYPFLDGVIPTVLFDVRVPRGARVDIRTEDGPIYLGGFAGMASGRTDNGDIVCEGLTGGVNVRTGNGGVACSRIAGAIEAETRNGTIILEDLDLVGAHGIRCATENGTIEVELDDRGDFEISAETLNGLVVSRRPMGEIRAGNYHRSLVGRVGSGGPLVELTTGNGTIFLGES